MAALSRNIITALIALFLLPGLAISQELFNGDSPVELSADNISYNSETSTYRASGKVVAVQGKLRLEAEELLLNAFAGVATVNGECVIYDERGGVLRGRDLQFDLKQNIAVIANARIFYKSENVHITADIIRKTGPGTYETEGTTFTTCDCEEGKNPAWHFYTTKSKVELGDYLVGRGAYFYISGIPVLYAPIFSVPVMVERQSGFLQPRTRYSELRGFAIENNFFWAISRSTDATLGLDIQSSRGAGALVEYRYIRGLDSFGELDVEFFKENDIERVRDYRDVEDNLSRPLDAGENRWRLKLDHTEVFYNNITLKAAIDLVSDDEYLLDFARNSEERSLESLESNVSLSRSWGAYNLTTQFRRFDNLLSKDDAETLQKYPEIAFVGTDRLITGTPLYFSIDSSFVNYQRDVGFDGQRLDLHPRVSLPLRPAGIFDLVPSIGARSTHYRVEEYPNGKNFERYMYDFKTDVATTFVRDFEAQDKIIRHIVRPRLTYTFVPSIDQSELPQFDEVDFVESGNSVGYLLTSTLAGTAKSGEKEERATYARLDVSQSFNIDESLRDPTDPTDESRPFSELSAELILTPKNNLRLTAKGEYDVYEKRFESYDSSLGFFDQRGDSISIANRFVRGFARYIEARARARLSPSLDFTYLNRYSVDAHDSIETSYGLEYTHQCWSATLSYADLLDERVVSLNFALRGLGKIAGIEQKIGDFIGE